MKRVTLVTDTQKRITISEEFIPAMRRIIAIEDAKHMLTYHMHDKEDETDPDDVKLYNYCKNMLDKNDSDELYNFIMAWENDLATDIGSQEHEFMTRMAEQ